MEARELRIGNWIQILGVETQVEGVSTWDNFIQNSNFAERELEEFEPITLTSERLRNCELANFPFEIFGDNQRGFHIALENGNWVFIKFLHHLQNLYFALTGEEMRFKTVGKTP